MAKRKRFSGMPVSEGVRLEFGSYTVFAVRNAEKDISVRLRREPRGLLRACMRIPFLRGVARLLRDIACFFDGLNESAEFNPQRPVRGTAAERGVAKFFKLRSQTIVTLTSAILIPIIAFLCLYAAPEGIDLLLRQRFRLSRPWLNAIVSVMRACACLLAIGLTVRLRVFRRLSMYKGALNKALNCCACKEELTVKNAAQYPICTRRSESAFLVSVLIVSLLLFPWLPALNLLTGALARAALVLLVAALLNEPFSALEEARLTLPVRVLRAPIDLLQHMTTLEPHPQMLEVAICAIEAALGENGKEVTSN